LTLLLAVLVNEPTNLSVVEKVFANVVGKSQFGGDTSLASSDSLSHLVSQRCLETLAFLTSEVPLIGKYFLTETDAPVISKTPKSSKKKGKEKLSQSASFPIVTLLNLLERPLYLANQALLEELILLLANLLRPLAHVAKKKFLADVEQTSNEQTPAKEKPEIKLPSIPSSSVRCVVSALKSSVSSGKTFQSTLSVLQHLCSYPENLEIVFTELLSVGRELSAIIGDDVKTLHSQLQSLPVNEGVKPEMIAVFTSPSASQAKFLRVLKAIDYLVSKNHGIQRLM
jgi:E3 ubiquitin-protein ligase HUWE1